MGVKSTRRLTRIEAERLYADLYIERGSREIREQASTMTQWLDNFSMEVELENMNDALNDGEGFTNYLIIDGDNK